MTQHRQDQTTLYDAAPLPASMLRRQVCLTVDGSPPLVTSEPRVVVGSNPSVDLVLDDTTVSRLHFEILAHESGHLIRDLGSTNGTLIGGLRVKEAYLAPKTLIRAGRSTIRFSLLPNADEVPLYPNIGFGEMVARSPIMRALFERLARVARRDATLLIEGESGTGKELAARAVHENSQRKDGPFVVVDCSSIPRTLIEAELFGHAKGAFTGATQARPGKFVQAHRGTIFLDEIGELDLDLQPRLLRVLERREVQPVGGSHPVQVDVRVVSATNRNLRHEINRKTFREDLFYRLAVTSVTLPPLRERSEDIPLLIDHFLSMHSSHDGLVYDIDEGTRRRLEERLWPGNIRELRNAIEELVVFGDQGDRSGLLAEIPLPATPGLERGEGVFKAGGPHALPPFKDEKARVVAAFELEYLRRLLALHHNNFSASASAAGLDRVHLLRLLDKHDLRK